MKKLFNILIFVSFIFLFIYLMKADLIIPELPHPLWLIPSLLLLFGGFYVSTLSWKRALKTHNINISHRDAIVSHGQAIFAKYIPGKIWVILGRASYISDGKKDLKNTSLVSFKEQLIYTWVGFTISAIPTVIFYGLEWISIILLLMIVLLTVFLFSPPIHRWSLNIIQKILKREFELPPINFRKSLPMIFATSMIWLCWTLSFYFFMRIFSAEITPLMAIAFPLSVCFGLIAILLPGGLGLREGIIVGYLVLAGMDVETATTISFLNRLAFISGEGFIFLLAMVVRTTGKKTAN